MSESTSFGSVIKNPGFLNLWVNQILVQLSYNSLNFALIIWVFRLTDSNTAVSALLFSIYLPAILFGLFAGVLVDITDRKKIILGINFLLSLAFFSLILTKNFYPLILLTAFFVNSLAQFYTPAESSAIPVIAKRNQLLAANSVFSTTLYVCFLLGFGLAGPLINHLSLDFVFGLEGTLLFIAFLLAFKFPSIVTKADAQGKRLIKAFKEKNAQEVKKVGMHEIRETLKLVRGRLAVFSSILIMAMVQVVVGVLAVLIPSFFERVMHINAADASYVLVLPLGLGMVAGGFLIGKIGNKFPRRLIVGRSILIAGLLFFVVGISPMLASVIHYLPKRPLPFFYQPPLSAILATGSFLLGITMVSIIVPSQTVIQENTPEEDRGKVFAVLAAAMSGLSLVPVFLTGLLADIFGTMPIFIAMGGVISLMGLFALKPDFYFSEHHLPFNIKEFLGLGHWERE